MYLESETVDLKEKYTDTIGRVIVAFLNTRGGEIYVGISDKGKVIGIPNENMDQTEKDIADCITTQIVPNPKNEIETSIIIVEDKKVVKISVSQGYKPIYCLKKYGFSPTGCLYRVGSTCREMSIEEINYRYNQTFIDDDYIIKAPAKYGSLSFNMIKILLTSRGFHINESTFDSNFNLLRENGDYNMMAELLADKNMVPLIFVKFRGKTKAAISQTNDYGGQSIVLGFQRLKDRLVAENICISDTTVRPRVDEYLYDMDCVNEALVNAIVHNDWTISEPMIAFFDDRLEITSHGGLPDKINKDDFFRGVSHPRNTTLMRIFLKLGIVEHTGHGIPRIIEKYGKDVFDINDTYINVIIPFNDKVMKTMNFGYTQNEEIEISKDDLNNNEKRVLLELINEPAPIYNTLVEELGISRRTLSRILDSLVVKGYIERVGTNKKGYWKVIK